MLLPRAFQAMIMSAALILPAAAQAPAEQTIQIRSYAFAPSPIRLAAGKAVTLIFVNDSGKGHDFSAKEFFAASRISAGDVQNGRVKLKPHETKSIMLVPVAGTFNAHCSHFMHDSLGMHTQVIVT